MCWWLVVAFSIYFFLQSSLLQQNFAFGSNNKKNPDLHTESKECKIIEIMKSNVGRKGCGWFKKYDLPIPHTCGVYLTSDLYPCFLQFSQTFCSVNISKEWLLHTCIAQAREVSLFGVNDVEVCFPIFIILNLDHI